LQRFRETGKIKIVRKNILHKYKANSIFIIKVVVFSEEIFVNILKIKNKNCCGHDGTCL
jgi:hypothetical protein